jgi:hypothetical protein
MSQINKYTAEIMDWEYIYILCPYCVKNNSKFKHIDNKGKSKTFKRVYHIYNTNDDYKNREMRVRSNCLFQKPGTEIDIVINHETMRIYK